MASVTTRVIRNARKRGVKVYTRKQWFCVNLFVYQWRRRFRKHKLCPGKKVDTLWAHITVTRRDHIKKDMRELHNIGMDRFGTGVSYNFGVDMLTGEVGLGQALDAAGAHTLNDKNIPGYSFNQNYVSFAIAFCGMPGAFLSKRAIQSAGKLIQAMIDEGVLTGGFDFNPHNMVAFKSCPTDSVQKHMPEIRKIGTAEFREDRNR